MRVLSIAPLPPPITGQAVASEAVVRRLRDDHVVYVANLSKTSLESGRFAVSRVFDSLRTVLTILKYRAICDRAYLTIARSHLGNVKDLVYLFLLGARLRRRTVVHLHGGGLRAAIPPKGLLRRLNEWLFGTVAGAIVLGPSLLNEVDGLVSAERTLIVPNGVDDGLFLPIEDVEAKFTGTEPLTVVFCSNFLEGKGAYELLDAVQLVPREQFTFRFAGAFVSDAAQREFETKICDLSNVRYEGVVTGSEKEQLFRSAHIFCLPTYYPYEGQPISILEAYAAGCAVVATYHAGIPDVFVDGENGIKVEPRSAVAVAEALQRFAIDRWFGLACGLRNRAMAGLRFTAQRYCDRVSEIIEDACH